MTKKKRKAPPAKPVPVVPDGLLSLEQAAGWLGVAPVTLRVWSVEGKVGYVRLGKRKLFNRQALLDFAAKNMVQAKP